MKTHGRARSCELTAADGNAGRAAIEGWLREDAAHALFSAGGVDFAAAAAAAAHAGFKPIALGMHIDATLHNSVRQFTSPNVIALWPGAGRRHEYVVYTAHWDHLGRDTARSGHNTFNGAVDNASGVAGLLAMAQSFVRTKPVGRPHDRVSRPDRRRTGTAGFGVLRRESGAPPERYRGRAQFGCAAKWRTRRAM